MTPGQAKRLRRDYNLWLDANNGMIYQLLKIKYNFKSSKSVCNSINTINHLIIIGQLENQLAIANKILGEEVMKTITTVIKTESTTIGTTVRTASGVRFTPL